LTLTDLDFTYNRNAEDSGVTLMMNVEGVRTWREPAPITVEQLAALGFDVSKSPGDKDAWRFYRRQRPRPAFLAIGLQGEPARLRVIDALGDAAALRARYPDRGKVAVVPAAVALIFDPPARQGPNAGLPPRIAGRVTQFPAAVNVPKPYSDGFRALAETKRAEGSDVPLYRITLTYGRSLEPWVSKVDFPAQPVSR
ncbi:MAG: DUF4824 family protein, partial [Acidobacteria bacterium]|nr:DUF4824 family protein [Acidobacteriota bacterium]